MFFNDDNSKLVPESTQTGGLPSWTIVDSLHEKCKKWRFDNITKDMLLKGDLEELIVIIDPPLYHKYVIY